MGKATTKRIKDLMASLNMEGLGLEKSKLNDSSGANLLTELRFDENAMQRIKLALNKSGMTFEEFCKKSVLVYTNTLLGKLESEDSLSSQDLSTKDLLENPKYSTYSLRPRELTVRAVKAIKMHNLMASDSKRRWIITQSLICELTGSRGTAIQRVLSEMKDDIDCHHALYPEFFNNDGTLNYYWNRKQGTNVKDEIDLIRLVPYG